MAEFEAIIDLSTLNGTTGVRLDGVAAQDFSGFSVASLGSYKVWPFRHYQFWRYNDSREGGTMNGFKVAALVAVLCVGSVSGAFDIKAAVAASVKVDAFDNGFYTGSGNHDPNNTNVLAGETQFGAIYNNWFAFDLSDPLLAGQVVTSATFTTYAGNGLSLEVDPDSDSVTYGLFDYGGSVDNLVGGTGDGADAHNDLGSGKKYGEVDVPISDGQPMPGLSISLLLALADINAALGSADKEFALGGTILSGSGLLWAHSGNTAGYLTLEVAPVPVPAALPLFLAGLAGLGFVGWRKNRRAAQA